MAQTKPGISKSARDMVLTLAVISAVMFAIYGFIQLRPTPEAIKVVDVDQIAADHSISSPFALYYPQGLSENWRPTSARMQPVQAVGLQWFTGWVTPEEKFASFTQSDIPAEQFVTEATQEGHPLNTSLLIGDFEWELYESDDGKTRSLVLPQVSPAVAGGGESATVWVVSGTATWDELEIFTAHLAPVPLEN